MQGNVFKTRKDMKNNIPCIELRKGMQVFLQGEKTTFIKGKVVKEFNEFAVETKRAFILLEQDEQTKQWATIKAINKKTQQMVGIKKTTKTSKTNQKNL